MIARYARWLHTQWYSGKVEQLPVVGELGSTAKARVRIAGDLLGVPLLKFASQSGAQAVNAFAEEGFYWSVPPPGLEELVVIGGGVSGAAAALEARLLGLKVRILEASGPLSTLANFQVGKPIYTYPTSMVPQSSLVIEGITKELLLSSLRKQLAEANIQFEIKRVSHLSYARDHVRVHIEGADQPILAKTVVIAVGRSGNFRKLGVPGEELGKVTNRLHDPKDYRGKEVLVVGGGDSASEAAIALAQAGANVHLAIRADTLSRAKAELASQVVSRLGERVLFRTQVECIGDQDVTLRRSDGSTWSIPNDNVFTLIGREPHREFIRKSGLRIAFDWGVGRIASFIFAFSAMLFLCLWKGEGNVVADHFSEKGWFPHLVQPSEVAAWFGSGNAPFRIVGEIFSRHATSPGFYYELLYTIVIVAFGLRRILRHRTPYITRQTLSLVMIQAIPLFLLPYLVLPLMEHWGCFDSGQGLWIANELFPSPEEGAPREYWRSVGLILAWPLFVWNVFTPAPATLWLVIAFLQTFVLIPWLVYKYGKGAYCGWICSCGALAETLGDAHRSKMPHGPIWNRLNMIGQGILAIVFALLALRVGSWMLGEGSPLGRRLEEWFVLALVEFEPFGIPLSYAAFVDFFLSGVVGLGLFFHFSGRTWCRFLCPLAALMHVYARFSRFRIFSDKKKCISCNGCTSVCHQGIDVMSFANRGEPMQDPQCVRCSACVTTCPTGVLSFGSIGTDGTPVLDRVLASPVQMAELKTVLKREEK
jgi:NosR/NirI family nitrous oxide reductase transcriptional regulator